MARINLLPWREAERKRRQKEFGVIAVSMLLLTLIVGGMVHWQIAEQIDHQRARNTFLQGEIAVLNRRIKEIRDLEDTKANLLARMEIIQQLQQSRPEVVHLFDELVNAIPDGVVLTNVKQTGRSIVLEGRAQSNARVSAFMRNIEGSQWIGDPLLLLIEQKEKTGTGLNHFRLRFEQQRPKPADDEEAAAPVAD